MELRVLQYHRPLLLEAMTAHAGAASWLMGVGDGTQDFLLVLQCRDGPAHDAPWRDVPRVIGSRDTLTA